MQDCAECSHWDSWSVRLITPFYFDFRSLSWIEVHFEDEKVEKGRIQGSFYIWKFQTLNFEKLGDGNSVDEKWNLN